MYTSTYTCVFIVLLIVLQVNSSCPAGSRELDDQCSTYCYQVVKPLLQYVNTIKSMTQEHNELKQTIKVQAETITNLKLQLAQQSKLSESFESHNRNQQKLVDQYEKQLTNLKLEIKTKDTEIRNLKSENVKIKELQDKIRASKETSSCLGKLSEVYSIRVPIAQTMTVPCDSHLAGTEAGAGWIVIQRRKDGGVNFNRTWSEYKNGFGNLRGEFFLGLEKIHLLTQSQPHELYVSVKDFSNATRYARYNNFVIGNEQQFYDLKELGAYSGTAGNALGSHRNQKFSTPDRYSHTSTTCAKEYASGWWFTNCYWSNLNGRYAKSDEGENAKSVEWRDWHTRPLKFTQMMIRPVE